MSKIVSKIKEKKITLDEYINLSLYKDKNSYYEKNKIFGVRGDYITSPYISSIFGEIISIYILNFFLNKGVSKFNILEIGAGEGLMAKDIINTLKKFEKINFKYSILEKSKNLKNLQKKKLKNFDVSWIHSLKNQNKKNLFIISNELLDAFPVKHLKKIKNIWYEKYVFYNKEKKEINSKYLRSKKSYKNILNLCNKDIAFIEYSPHIFKLLQEISDIIKYHSNNCFMTIDYGYYSNQYKNTLQGLKKHKKVSVFHDPGNTDITYLVNFNLIKQILKKNDLNSTLNMSQSKFLINTGILLRLEQAKKKLNSNKEKMKLEMAVERLIDPANMGGLFKVLIVDNAN